MRGDIDLYGHYVFTHGWRRVLTIMSPAGTAAVRDSIRVDSDVEMFAAAGRLVQLHERRAGALDRTAALNNIRILDKTEWDALKSRSADSIYR